MQMAKIDKFTKSQLSTLKKRVKSLREQVKDVKEGEGNNNLTQVSQSLNGTTVPCSVSQKGVQDSLCEPGIIIPESCTRG